METNKPYRVVLMFVGFFTVIAAITFNSLSGFGTESGEYLSDTLQTHLSDFFRKLCLCVCRHFQADNRKSDSQVYNSSNSSSVGSVCVGFHIYLAICHVYILYSRPL